MNNSQCFSAWSPSEAEDVFGVFPPTPSLLTGAEEHKHSEQKHTEAKTVEGEDDAVRRRDG